MIDNISKIFPISVENKCLSSVSDQSFRVYDREDKCCFICTENEPDTLSYFTVKNPEKKPITLLAIDKCVFNDSDEEKRCDCAVFDDSKFYFVEIKTCSNGKKGKQKGTAFKQLKHTISMFKSQIDFGNYELFALTCIGKRSTFPRSTASHMGRYMEMSLLKTRLVEGNEITF